MYSEPLKHEFQSCEGLIDGFCSFKYLDSFQRTVSSIIIMYVLDFIRMVFAVATDL